jgi:hypothetical protein
MIAQAQAATAAAMMTTAGGTAGTLAAADDILPAAETEALNVKGGAEVALRLLHRHILLTPREVVHLAAAAVVEAEAIVGAAGVLLPQDAVGAGVEVRHGPPILPVRRVRRQATRARRPPTPRLDPPLVVEGLHAEKARKKRRIREMQGLSADRKARKQRPREARAGKVETQQKVKKMKGGDE